MPVWVSNAQDWALYEERRDRKRRLARRNGWPAASESEAPCHPGHHTIAVTGGVRRHRSERETAIKHVAGRAVSYILDADVVEVFRTALSGADWSTYIDLGFISQPVLLALTVL
jgi:hypothetical protein